MTKLIVDFRNFTKRAYNPVSYGNTTACGQTFEWWMVKVQHVAQMANRGPNGITINIHRNNITVKPAGALQN